MNSDPKLIRLMEKIEKLCEEADVGAHVNLVSKTHGEFGFVLPKWGALYEEILPDTTTAIRLKFSRAQGDTHEKAELTAHFLHSMRDVFVMAFKLTNEFIEITDAKWKTEHVPFSNFQPKTRPD